MTNERRCGVVEQPNPACPMVDEGIELVDAVELEVSYIRPQFEKLRTRIEEVREWGQEWKELYLTLERESESKVDELNDEISYLERLIAQKDETIAHYEKQINELT